MRVKSCLASIAWFEAEGMSRSTCRRRWWTSSAAPGGHWMVNIKTKIGRSATIDMAHFKSCLPSEPAKPGHQTERTALQARAQPWQARALRVKTRKGAPPITHQRETGGLALLPPLLLRSRRVVQVRALVVRRACSEPSARSRQAGIHMTIMVSIPPPQEAVCACRLPVHRPDTAVPGRK